MGNKKYELISAIDIGSNYIRMSIAQASSSGELECLEDLIKPTDIGRDTFSTGRISVQTIHDTCDVLKGFSKLIKDYRVKNIKAVSTTGIREAENQEYIIEQIRLRTGFDIEVINNAQERFFMYKALRSQLPDSESMFSESTLIVNITSGGIEVSIYEKDKLMFTEYVKLGSLRLRELLSELETMTVDFPKVMEEYIESKIYFLKNIINNNIKNFIGLGGELKTIYSLCYGGDEADKYNLFIEKGKLKNIYKELSEMSSEQIMDKYKISTKQEEILLPSVILLNSFLRLTKAEGINAPMTSLRHGILFDMADEIFHTDRKKNFQKDIISSVWYIAKKYGVVKSHATYVEKLALDIFDQTSKLHRLKDRERLFLQVAAILHDSGNYVSFSEHDYHSFNVIRRQNIMGFSSDELLIIANIARYHAIDIPSNSHDNYKSLSHKEKIIVSKLASILKLAESLDISHTKKIDKLEITLSGDELIFVIYAKTDTLLEEWDFTNSAGFFEEIMGIKPIIKNRG